MCGARLSRRKCQSEKEGEVKSELLAVQSSYASGARGSRLVNVLQALRGHSCSSGTGCLTVPLLLEFPSGANSMDTSLDQMGKSAVDGWHLASFAPTV